MTEAIRENAVKIEGRKYIVVSPDLDNVWEVGTILTLSEDDGTNLPWFTDTSGKEDCVYMHEVMLLAETEEQAEEPLEESTLPEHKYAVGQKLTVNGNTDIWNCYEAGTKVTVKSTDGHWGECNIPRYNVISDSGKEQLVHEGQLDLIPTHITEEQYAEIEVGDTIAIRDDLEIGRYGNDSVTEEMLDYRGEQLEVSSRSNYTNKVGSKSWNWTQQMIAEVIKKEPVAEKPEFKPEVGQFYYGESTEIDGLYWGIKVSEVVEVENGTEYEMKGNKLYHSGYESNGDLFTGFDRTNWTPATDDQKIQLLTAMAEHGDATDSDLELLSELTQLDNPELEVGEVYFRGINTGNTWIFRYAETSNFGIPFHSAISPNADKFFSESHMNIGDYRKALPHEVVKLEAAEKEHGCEYKKPLINSKGTVIEVGQYYKSETIGGSIVYCVSEVTDTHFNRGDSFLDLSTGQLELTFCETVIGSVVGKSAVPATQEEIAEFKAAESRSKISKGQKYLLNGNDGKKQEIEVTNVTDNGIVQFKYKSVFNNTVTANLTVNSPCWKDAELVK